MSSRYDETYARSLAEPEAFWAEAAEGIDWEKRWDRVLDDSRSPFCRWFVGAEVNTCHNALDRHVAAGRGDRTALIYDSPVTDTVQSFTYAELQGLAARFAGALSSRGVRRGDRVVLYMPMIPEAAIAMLACARIGAVHSVVFGGFAANELATRIDDAKPRVIVCGSCGIEVNRVIAYKPLLDDAIELASHKPERCIVVQRAQQEATLVAGRDETWDEAMAGAEPADCVPVAATDPLYILYTSGTTGDPKGIVRDNGGHLVALNWTMHGVYARQPGQVWWAASDIGWVVGHSYIVYAPLIYGCPSILYEGKPVGTPDAGAYWRVISQHGVSAMFTAPTAFRAIKRDDPDAARLADYDIACFDTLFLAGERTDPDTLAWAEQHLERPVYDHWWQTESGWPMGANCAGLGALPVKPGSPTKPVPGYRIEVVDEEGAVVPAGDIGSIVVKQPLPPGFTPTLWNNDARFEEAYFTRFPRLLPDRRCGRDRRGRLPLDHEPHRRHHQRGRPSPLDRRHGGGAGGAPGRGGMRRRRRGGRAQGPASARLRGAEGGRQPAGGRDRGRARAHGAREHRPGGRLQAGGGGRAPAEDPLRQDPARHHGEDRRRRGVQDARHHRRPGNPGRDRRRDQPSRLRRRPARGRLGRRLYASVGERKLSTVRP